MFVGGQWSVVSGLLLVVSCSVIKVRSSLPVTFIQKSISGLFQNTPPHIQRHPALSGSVA
ncbi:hypothetical protein DDZ15_14155 [Rhodohalobacter mucosus]|uniref:Uncharacterized protein n=1 Tax=Rhodohalobacter mucosus TaxID=2079485 RepID=A0A316TTV9_9BACT|nr:hypothetical protein DDZ15_14155 [Rhodohalobacter mucosus]